MEANSTRLPPEVIHNIVCFVRIHPWAAFATPQDKRGVAGCSQVCRYWASLLRALLFRLLALRKAEDIAALLEILNCPIERPGPPLSLCIIELQVTQFCDWTVSTANTFRAVTQRLREDLVFLVLKVSDIPHSTPQSSSSATRTEDYLPFFTLPTPLPGRLIPLTELFLDRVQMRRKVDLVRLLDNFSTIRKCTLTRLLFRDNSNIRRRLSRSTSKLRVLSVAECGDGALETQIELACGLLASQKGVRVDENGAWAWAVPLRIIRDLQPMSGPHERQSVAIDICE